jgi:hypothetical protein
MHLLGPDKLDPEAELLLQCAQRELDTNAIERVVSLLRQDLNWELLLRLAQRNGLLPLLAFHLAVHPSESVEELIPSQHREFLRDYFKKNKALNTLLTGELLRLLKVFDAQRIEAMPYKGPALAVELYGDLALRQFCDLDVMVRETDVWKATELLTEQGFEPHFDIPVEKQDAFTRLGYVRLFRRDAGRTVVEMHWRIAPRFFDVEFDMAELWQRLRRTNLLDTRVVAPPPEDLLLMLSVHAAKDFWEKLEWVAAVNELLKHNPVLDWDLLLTQARKSRCERMLLTALSLSRQLFGTNLPVEILGRLNSESAVSLAQEIIRKFFDPAATLPEFSSRIRFHLRLKDHSVDRLRYCSRLALTTTPLDWAAAPKLPTSLFFLHLPLRAVRLIKRYGLTPRSAHVWLLTSILSATSWC